MRTTAERPFRRLRRTVAPLAPTTLIASCGHDAPSAPSTPAPPVASRLPTLTINTTGGAPVVSRDDYVAGTSTLRDTFDVVRQLGPLEVKGHGHSTWDLFPKKPYHEKLGSSVPMLSMPASKHWILLAIYSDKTLLRNAMAFDFSRALGAEYTPHAEDVELVLNGTYQGIYKLAEQVRIAPERVNIPSLKAADTSATDGLAARAHAADARAARALKSLSTAVFGPVYELLPQRTQRITKEGDVSC
jgi:CotH kinase protein